MDSANVSKLIMAHSAMQNLSVKAFIDGKLQLVTMNEDLKEKAIASFLPVVVQESATTHDFNFACDWTTFPGGTVVGDASYTLTGKSNDCRDVISIMYGPSELKLNHYRQADMDALLSGQTSPDTVTSWIEDAPINGFPVATLVGTPTVAGEQIKYRYRHNRLSVEGWPEQFILVLVLGVVSCFDTNYIVAYEKKLQQMIAHYTGSKPSVHTLPINNAVTRLNKIRNQGHGYR